MALEPCDCGSWAVNDPESKLCDKCLLKVEIANQAKIIDALRELLSETIPRFNELVRFRRDSQGSAHMDDFFDVQKKLKDASWMVK